MVLIGLLVRFIQNKQNQATISYILGWTLLVVYFFSPSLQKEMPVQVILAIVVAVLGGPLADKLDRRRRNNRNGNGSNDLDKRQSTQDPSSDSGTVSFNTLGS